MVRSLLAGLGKIFIEKAKNFLVIPVTVVCPTRMGWLGIEV